MVGCRKLIGTVATVGPAWERPGTAAWREPEPGTLGGARDSNLWAVKPMDGFSVLGVLHSTLPGDARSTVPWLVGVGSESPCGYHRWYGAENGCIAWFPCSRVLEAVNKLFTRLEVALLHHSVSVPGFIALSKQGAGSTLGCRASLVTCARRPLCLAVRRGEAWAGTR